MHYIIDGYNLLHKSGVIDYCKGDYEYARDMLEQNLAGFLDGNKGARITIVYDAAKVPNIARYIHPSRVRTLFTSQGEIADTRIREIVDSATEEERKGITVVTSDNPLRTDAMFSYVHTMGAKEFAGMTGL